MAQMALLLRLVFLGDLWTCSEEQNVSLCQGPIADSGWPVACENARRRDGTEFWPGR